jgi:hypothetical protein
MEVHDVAEVWCRLAGRALDALDAIASWEFGNGLGEDTDGLIGFAGESARLIRSDYPAISPPHTAEERRALSLSDLIKRYGDDKISFQKIDDCAQSMSMTARGTKITFVTPEPLSPIGLDKLGLVVWFDRERIATLLGAVAERRS